MCAGAPPEEAALKDRLALVWFRQMAAVQPLLTVPKLRIICFNIHHGEGIHGELDLARVSAVIRASGAQVAALQEVDRSDSKHTIAGSASA